jgi:NAD(P)-dependent dehydrogenase (short-subunit alcohol dehydrogenase family)
MHYMSDLAKGYVVTGGGRGVGRAIVDRLLVHDAHVAVIELDDASLDWVADHPQRRRIASVIGNAADEAVASRAADAVEAVAPLVGWVNNAAIFRDATVHESSSATIMELISANLAPAVAGSVAAIRCYLRARRPGAIVNVSSHQAQRAVRGAVPYATAKAAVEGLTRALAVDYGPFGIRVNAVALGSISTERYEDFLNEQTGDEAQRTAREIARLHPLGRVGQAAEVAAAVAYLLSDDASFVSGAVLPIDGGRSAQGQDPEER